MDPEMKLWQKLVPAGLIDAPEPEVADDLCSLFVRGWEPRITLIDDWIEREILKAYALLYEQNNKIPDLQEVESETSNSIEEIVIRSAMIELGEDMECIIACFEENKAKGKTTADNVDDFIEETASDIRTMVWEWGDFTRSVEAVLNFHDLCYITEDVIVVSINGIDCQLHTDNMIVNQAQQFFFDLPLNNVLTIERVEVIRPQ